MPRAFSEREKEVIKDRLMEEGYQLFSRYGIKKTGISELTEKVGIARGSFYSFFNSKEELYFAVLEREEKRIKEKLVSEKMLRGEFSRQEFEDFLYQSFCQIDENPLLKRLYLGNEYELLIRKLPEEKITEHINDDEDLLRPIIRKMQDKKIMIREEPEVIVGLIRAIFTVSLHKHEIGAAIYEDTVRLLIKITCEGLFKSGRDGSDKSK